jgi:uncharacterized protein (DUF433 family)
MQLQVSLSQRIFMTVVVRLSLEQVVSRDPDILAGTPVFTGTRVPVQSLIDHLRAGDTLEDFLEGFPSVSREQAEGFLELAFQAAVSGIDYACAA